MINESNDTKPNENTNSIFTRHIYIKLTEQQNNNCIEQSTKHCNRMHKQKASSDTVDTPPKIAHKHFVFPSDIDHLTMNIAMNDS